MNSYNLIVRKLEGNRYFGRSTIRRKDNTVKAVKEIATRDVDLGLSELGNISVMGCC